MVIQFKGRENAHKDLGFVAMQRIIEDLKSIANVDQAPRLGGRVIAMTLSPLPQGQRKRKFHLFHGELLEEDDHDDEEDDDNDSIAHDEDGDVVTADDHSA